MKYLLIIALSILCSFGSAEEGPYGPYGPEVTLPPEDRTIIDELEDIVQLMVNMEDKLQEDRHDTTVQLEGQKIEDELDKLIDEFDERIEKDKKKNGKKPLKDSEKDKTNINENITIEHPSPDIDWRFRQPENGTDDRRVTRWGTEYDLRWRKRIEAYFLSVNAEEQPTLNLKELRARLNAKK